VATANIVGDTSDNKLAKYSASSWAACLSSTPTPGTVTSGSDTSPARNGITAWALVRSFLRFDLSPYAGATITAATLNIFAMGYLTSALKVYYSDWGPTVAAADWVAGTLASSEVQPSTSSMQWCNIALSSPQGILTANGGVYLALSDETTDPSGANNYCAMYFADNATEKPNLDITYSIEFAGLSVYRNLSGTG